MVLLHQGAYVVRVYLQLTADGFHLACHIYYWLVCRLICVAWRVLLASLPS